MHEEDAEKRRLRQLAEMSGSLAPSRIGAWTTPGHVAGESWSELPLLGRVAFVVLFVMLAAFIVLLLVAAVRAGDTPFVVAWVAVMACGIAIGLVRRRRSARRDRRADPDSMIGR